MITIKRHGNAYEMRFSEPGSGMRAFKVLAAGSAEIKAAIDHYYFNHVLDEENCPFCRDIGKKAGPVKKTRRTRHEPIPGDWPVQPLKPGEEAESKATCGHCGLSWDDGRVTGMTPTPSARCPFEPFHIY